MLSEVIYLMLTEYAFQTKAVVKYIHVLEIIHINPKENDWQILKYLNNSFEDNGVQNQNK